MLRSDKAYHPKLIPQRIREAREYCRMSVADIADRLGKSRQTISQYENGTTNPSSEVVRMLANITGFPVQYFTKPKLAQNSSNSQIPLYRGSPAKSKALRRSYEVVSGWSNEIVTSLRQYVTMPCLNLPEELEFDFLNTENTVQRIETLCGELRRFWGLGSGPIYDVVGVLENNGFIISKIPNRAAEVDAFSIWYDGTPHVFYGGNRDTAVSYRFSVCHELGHLILHQSLQETESLDAALYKEMERQANLFSGAFLMPAETFGAEYLTSSLDSFLSIKKKWKVSLSAMIMRAEAIGIIDVQQKNYLFRQLNARKYRTHEPYDDEIDFLEPGMLYNAIRLLIENRIISMRNFVDDAGLPIEAIAAICSLPDEFMGQSLSVSRGVPYLRVVK